MTIQDKMYQEMRNKNIFEKAQAHGYQYLDEIFERSVYPTEEALENLKYFEEDMPIESSEAVEIIDFLNQYGAPATVNIIGGRYFGFVNGSVVPVGLAAKNLASYWDQNTPMYIISPICSKLETIVEGWLKSLFNLPEKTVAGFVSGTSNANFCGLAAARYRLLQRLGWDIGKKGLFTAPKIRVVMGELAHSSILKAIALLGFGRDDIELVKVDDEGRMLPEYLPELDDKTILILQAGEVNSGAFDPFEILCKKANKAGAWVHVDGAFGLWVEAIPQLKHLTAGIGKANSWTVDGHKTLNTPYDCGIVLCEDKEALISSLNASGSYLVISETHRDGMFYTPEMSRRSRIIELWAILKYLGRKGIEEMIYGLYERSIQLVDELNKIDGFEVLNELIFNQVLVRCKTDDLTAKTITKIQELRTCWLGGSVWQGQKVIRVSICSWTTTPQDITRTVQSFEKALALVIQESL